jgi:Holliday junction resolvasome RuvABC DNA-binding subunit
MYVIALPHTKNHGQHYHSHHIVFQNHVLHHLPNTHHTYYHLNRYTFPCHEVYSQNFSISEAAEALTVLGYDKTTALSILKGIDPSITDTGEIIRLALKKLAR